MEVENKERIRGQNREKEEVNNIKYITEIYCCIKVYQFEQ